MVVILLALGVMRPPRDVRRKSTQGDELVSYARFGAVLAHSRQIVVIVPLRTNCVAVLV
jgi:hypothetical protein